MFYRRLMSHLSTAIAVKKNVLNLPYETSIATISLPTASIYEKMRSIKNAGFNSFELMELDLPEISSNLNFFKSKVDELDLKISIFQPFRDLEGDWENFDSRLMEFDKRLKLMKFLGIDLILLCSNCLEIEFNENRFIKQLRIASDIAAENDIRIAFEALSWGTHYKTIDDLWSVVKKVDKDNFGVCLDSFHIFIHRGDLSLIKEMANKIFFVQLSDSEFNLQLPNVLYQSRSYRNLPYQGSFNNLELLKAIDEVGYDGPISLECFSEVFRSYKDLNYSSKESQQSLVYLITELMKFKQFKLPSEILDDGKIIGFNILTRDPSFNGIIEFTDPLLSFPDVELIVDDKTLFEKRLKLFRYDTNFPFQNIINYNGNHCQKKLTINCSRLTYNSLVLYFKSVLHLTENIKKQKFSKYGLTNSKTFTNGEIEIQITSFQDKIPILKTSL